MYIYSLRFCSKNFSVNCEIVSIDSAGIKFAPTVSAYKRPLSVLKLGQEILPYKQVFALAPILAGPAEGKKLLNHKYRNDCQ